MKKLLLLLVCSLIISKSKAQVVFCPPGAKWTYNFRWTIPYNLENFSITYLGDTISGTDTLKILSPGKFYIRQNCKYSSRTLIKQKGDTIFMNNNKTQNTWQILYNFAALPGDVWITTFLDNANNPITQNFMVDSVKYLNINGMNLKTLYVGYGASGFFGLKLILTERFGYNSYLYNFIPSNCTSDADVLDHFLCYTDNSFGTKQFTERSCQYTDAVGITEFNSGADLNIKIYPNPSKDFIIIETNSLEETEMLLTDISGREVKRLKISNSDKIDLGELSKGIYLIQLLKNSKLVYSTQLIKE